ALAQGLTITPDKDCFTCAEGEPNFTVAELAPDNIVEFDVGGRSEADEFLCFNFYLDGVYEDDWQHPNEQYYYMWAYCDDQIIFWDHVQEPTGGGDASPSDIHLPFAYGEWTVEVCPGMCEDNEGVSPAQDCAETTVLLAEVCPEAVEFVPEPGSILLLGSGLAGLAGYAGLRWRTRE
ncbi:MAG: PEP-CTERM sorting domain-containing protein, partial [Anaerolineae bacterium]